MNKDATLTSIRNILFNCAKLTQGDRILIISEDPSLGWYDKLTPELVTAEAKSQKISVTNLEVGEPDNSEKKEIENEVNKYDCTIFFARLGDQDRFDDKKFRKKRVMSYIRSAESLNSTFGTTPYEATVELKNTINEIFRNGKYVEITCPLGSKLSGNISIDSEEEKEDVSVLRFPMVVPKPVKADSLSGTILIDKCLTPTGSKVYQPAFVLINDPIKIEIKNGRIIEISGNPLDVKNFKSHYKNVANQFDIDENCVHSFHAGIHPGIEYNKPMKENPDKWSNTLFASPKFLHFHTCGNYAPGEICWMISDHTIKIDSVPLWENGQLIPENFQTTKACVEKWEGLQKLFKF